MLEEFDFLFRRRRRRYTKFDFYLFLAILFAAIILEKPENMWWYITGIIVIIICSIYIDRARQGLAPTSIINHTASVPSKFVKDKNTLGNVHCVAKYFPIQKKIIVMDHPESKAKTSLRTFEVNKDNVGNVDKVWFDICSVFDEYTFFDTLFSYIDKNSGVLKLEYLHNRNKAEVDRSKIGYDEYTPPTPSYKKDALVYDEYGDPLINIENLEKQNTNNTPAEEVAATSGLVDMDTILKPGEGKIDINIANAEKLAELPGINIVKAKKIVAYRDKNGFFKTKEDFYKASDIKNHFIPQLEELITVDKTSKIIVEDWRRKNERIVD